MSNLNKVELIINALDENDDYLTLKEEYDISQNEFIKITEVIKNEAEKMDNIGINIQYEIWEFIIINTIDRYITREYNVKTGRQLKKTDEFAEECVRRSIAESSPITIPNIEYIRSKK